jgi:hypothetical protein
MWEHIATKFSWVPGMYTSCGTQLYQTIKKQTGVQNGAFLCPALDKVGAGNRENNPVVGKLAGWAT